MAKDVLLNNGVSIPRIGYGTASISGWQHNNKHVIETIKTAINMGYRYIDTSTIGGNEQSVGQAIKKSNVERSQLFVSTKVWNHDQGYEETLRAFEYSCQQLDLDVIDLYLIHWPIKGKIKDTWRALERLYKDKRVSAIGVSNFRVSDLEHLLRFSKIKPTCNQIELHPYFSQLVLKRYCAQHNIHIIGWSPLGSGSWSKVSSQEKPINDLTIKSIAKEHTVSPSQIILRWNIQHDIIPIPKSETPEHMRQNIFLDHFSLSENEMKEIDSLDKEMRIGPNPDHNDVEFFL